MATGVCKDCNSACLEAVPDGCIVWTGESFPVLNIVKGNAYSTNIINLARELEKLVKASANLHCLWDGCGTSSIVDVPTAVQVIIDKICALTTDDITNKAEMSCIINGTNSVEATVFNNKYSSITTNSTSTGGNFQYDLTSVTAGLPEGYDIQRINVVARGNSVNGNSVISSSNSPQGIIAIPNQRYPVLVTVEVTANTPSGVVKLEQNVAIVSSSVRINSPYEFDIVDYGGVGTTAKNLTTAISAISAAVCTNKTNITQLKTIQITDTENIKFPSKARDAVIGTIVAELDEVITKVDAPGDFPIFATQCGGECGSTVIASTLQAVLDSYGQKVCELVSTVNELIVRLNVAEQRIRACCTSDTFDSEASISGGAGTTIQGICIGNSCP